MGSTTAHGFPYPVGTDRVMDGDNAMQALAEAVDAQLYAGASAPASSPGLWQAASGIVVCTNVSMSAQPGTSVTWARFMKLSKTVWFQGEATTTTAVTGVAISLPNAQAGTPLNFQRSCGSLAVWGATAPADQSGLAYMVTDKTRIQPVAYVISARNLPANHFISWSVVYEVT